MKRLLLVISLSVMAWTVWWWHSASRLERATQAWLEQRRAAGWVAEIDDVTLLGFPNRLDQSFAGFSLANPAQGWAWHPDFFQVLRLSYKPRHVIAVWPRRQTLATPHGRVEIESDEMRASVRSGEGKGNPLERFVFNAQNPKLNVRSGSTVLAAQEVRFAVDEKPNAAANSYRMALLVEQPTLAMLGNTGPDMLSAQFDVVLTQALEVSAFPDTLTGMRATSMDLHKAVIGWGETSLEMAGRFTFNEAGAVSGTVDLKARAWEKLLNRLGSGGEGVETFLQTLSALHGRADTLDIRLTLRDNQLYFGAIPLGQISLN